MKIAVSGGAVAGRIRCGLLAVVFAVAGQAAVAADELPQNCGSLRNNYGPFDYRRDKSRLWIVEQAHFTPEIENLIHGKTGTIAGELDYTLRAFPNHHRALVSMVRLVDRKGDKPYGARYSMECYLKRAEVFAPNDGTVKMLYGIHKMKRGDTAGAIEYLEVAEQMGGASANLEYNLGLAYFRAKQYDKSLEHAHKAYALGFNLPGLRKMLEKAGKWRDPEPAAAQVEDKKG